VLLRGDGKTDHLARGPTFSILLRKRRGLNASG
jgi:hypothetical protein